VLLLLGVDQRSMMGIMGWSNSAMTVRYAHVVEPIRKDIATRLSGLLWEPNEGVRGAAEIETRHAAAPRLDVRRGADSCSKLGGG